jgi:hypothetical protein
MTRKSVRIENRNGTYHVRKDNGESSWEVGYTKNRSEARRMKKDSLWG